MHQRREANGGVPVRYRRIVAAVVLGAPLLAGVTAAPAVAATNCVKSGTPQAEERWAQMALDLDRTGALTRGDGQKVAVLSTGVDANHAQLAGRVDGGQDVTGGSAAPTTDCQGTGTQVAGVIAAAKLPDAAFVGVAPAARVIPIRVVSDSYSAIDPAKVASGIHAALSAGATVICVPLAVYDDSSALRGAVEDALSAGVPVVAAAGDGGTQGNPPPYPAAYPGVLAVAAIDLAGQVQPASGSGDFVRIAAPGAAVDTLQAGGGLVTADGSALAAGAVAGTVALVRARYPHLSPDEIAARLIVSATPETGYPADPHLAGMVNPFRALIETPANGSPAAIPGYQPASPDPVQDAQRGVRDRALLIAAGTLLATVIATLLAVFAPRARRRSWRPTVAPPVPAEPEPTEATPPIPLFEDTGSPR
jgi:membrane-anchored mycosin MYCP